MREVRIPKSWARDIEAFTELDASRLRELDLIAAARHERQDDPVALASRTGATRRRAERHHRRRGGWTLRFVVLIIFGGLLGTVAALLTRTGPWSPVVDSFLGG